jgi:hypothetical protein
MLLDLLFSLIKIVAAGSWSAPVLLLGGNQIKVVILAQAEVELIVLAFLLILGLVPGVLQSVVARRGQCLHHLDVIIHVEASPGDVVMAGCFVGRLVLPLSHLFDGILVDFRRPVFGVVPGNVSVGVVVVDELGAQWYKLRVLH